MKTLDTMNVGTVGLNVGNIQAYQSAIKGLSAEQAVFALATKGANAAQIEEIMTTETATLAKGTYTQADVQAAMAKHGLATASAILTVAQQKEITNSGLLSAEKMAEMASVLGLTTAENGSLVSKKALNAEMVKQQLESISIVGATQAQIMSILGLATAETGAVAGTNLLTASFAKLWAVISAHPIGAIITAVGALAVGVVSAANASNKAKEEARQTAIELTNTYTQEKDSLDSQIEKYKELKETLDNGNLSTDEARSIKEQLLGIQESLIESYGNEASNIDLVNGKYKEQLGLLSELSKEKATDYVIENRDVFEDAKKALEKERTYNLGRITSWSSYVPQTEDQQALLDFIDSYSELFEITNTGSTSQRGEHFAVRNLQIKANVEDADNIMRQFAIDLEKYGEENDIDVSGMLESISGQLKKTWTDELTEYKTVYDEFMKAEIVRNDTLRPLYQESIQAVEDYNKALSTGEGIEEAKANLESVQQSVQSATGELEGSQSVFDGIYEGINKDAEVAYNLGKAFENDKTVQNYAEQLRGLTYVDLKAINFDNTNTEKGEKAFKGLMETLGLTEEQVQSLIGKLVELGYVQGNVQSSTSSELFSSFDNTNLGERLQHANKLFQEGELTHKQYFDSLQNEIDNFDASNFTDSLEDANKASQQFFTDSVQQSASGLSDLINKFDAGEMSVSEYLDGYLAIGETLSTLADNLQENSSAWDKNGEAMSDAVSSGLDSVQSDLDNAMSTITGYKDSIYSLEQIMTGAVKAGSDEFTAHTNVIAQDLANIVSSGGEMASEVANTLGTTTSEIASNLTKNVSNQSLAAQAIAANTNIAISDMATSVANIFTTLGNAISNFNVDISFSKTSGSLIDAITGNGELKFNLSASGETLSTIGDAIGAFGETLALNIQPQLIEAHDFSLDMDEYTPDVDTLKNYNDELDRLKDSSKGASKSTDALTEAMEKQKKALEDQKSALEEQKQHYEDVYSAIKWFYDKQIDKQQKCIDNLEKQNELLELQLGNYDDAISAVERFYDSEIDKIQEKINALDKANTAAEKEIAIEKAKQVLEEARNNKTKMVYTKNRGFVYQADQDAIASAENDLASANEDKIKYDLQAQIDKLQEYKKLWSEIPDAYEQAQQDMMMKQLLGANWEYDLMNGRIEAVTTFKENYIAIQTEINNNEELIKSYEEKIEVFESLKQQWEDLTSKFEEETYTQLLIGQFGNDYENELLNGRTSRWDQFANDYYNIQVQLKDVTDQIEELAKRMEDYATRMESAASRAESAAARIKAAGNGVGGGNDTSERSYYLKPYDFTGHAKGGFITKKDKSYLDPLAEAIGEDHMIAVQEGEYVVPKKTVEKNPELVNALSNSDDVEKWLEKEGWKKIERLNIDDKTFGIGSIDPEVFERFNVASSMTSWNIPTPEWDPEKYINNTTNNNQNTTELHFHGNLSFPNITDGNDARKLIDELSSISLKAHQYANKR